MLKSIKPLLIVVASTLILFTGFASPAMAQEELDFNYHPYRLTTGMDLEQWMELPSPMLLAQNASGETTASGTGADSMTEEERAAAEEAMIAEALANPLSYLWLLFTQNDTYRYSGDILDALGEDDKTMNTFLLMPVFSLQLTEKWKTIIRPVIPINTFETIDEVTLQPGNLPPNVDFKKETGIGDIVLWTAFSKKYEPPFVWGFGPTIMMNTASEDQLGTGKWSAGPMFLAMNISEKWIIGGVAQHWWSFSGDDDFKVDTILGPVTVDRPDVNLTDFQYIIRYRLNTLTNIGSAPNVRYNWETEQLNFPLGIGFDTLIKIGPLPVKVGAEVHYYAERSDDLGPEWLLRLYLIPVIPSPGWAREAIF